MITILDEKRMRLEEKPKRFLFSDVSETVLVKAFLEALKQKAQEKIEEARALENKTVIEIKTDWRN